MVLNPQCAILDEFPEVKTMVVVPRAEVGNGRKPNPVVSALDENLIAIRLAVEEGKNPGDCDVIYYSDLSVEEMQMRFSENGIASEIRHSLAVQPAHLNRYPHVKSMVIASSKVDASLARHALGSNKITACDYPRLHYATRDAQFHSTALYSDLTVEELQTRLSENGLAALIRPALTIQEASFEGDPTIKTLVVGFRAEAGMIERAIDREKTTRATHSMPDDHRYPREARDLGFYTDLSLEELKVRLSRNGLSV